jgi:hypothetical protein
MMFIRAFQRLGILQEFLILTPVRRKQFSKYSMSTYPEQPKVRCPNTFVQRLEGEKRCLLSTVPDSAAQKFPASQVNRPRSLDNRDSARNIDC